MTASARQAVASELGGLILRIDAQGAVLDYGAAEAGDQTPGTEELLGRRLDEILPGEAAVVAMQALAAALESGAVYTIQYATPVDGDGLQLLEARFAPTRGGQCLVVIAGIAGRETAQAAFQGVGETTKRPRAGRAVELQLANRRLAGEVEGHRRIEHALRRSEARARRAEERLRRAIEGVTDAFALWDPKERLVLRNQRFADLYPELAEHIRPGVKLEQLCWLFARSGLISETVGREEQWVAERLARHRAEAGQPFERQLADGRWLRISDCKTRRGDVVCIQSDITELKRREHALEKSEARALAAEQRLRQAIESVSDAFVLWDAEDRLVLCNERFRTLYPEGGAVRPGVSFEELVTQLARSGRISEAVGREAEWVAERQRQRRERVIAPLERRFTDGRWVRICGYRTADGGMVSIHTDITELKQREEALRERELQLRGIIDNIPGVVYRRVRHPDGRITFPYHSSQVEPRYGFDAAALATDSSPLQEAIHPDDRARWLAAVEQSASDLTPFDVDYRFRSPGGEWRWIRSLATPTGRDDGSVSWDGISFDVTELKATEGALRESEERYRRLVEAGPDAIVIHQNGSIRFANFRAAELAGVAHPHELIGRPIKELLHPADRAGGVAPVRRWLKEGDVVELREARVLRADGHSIPVEITAVAVAEGERPAVQAVIRDISKGKRTQEALRESEERYRRLIQTAPIALLTHRQGRIRFANAKAVDLLGVGLPSALKGRSLISFVDHQDRPVARLRMRRVRERRGLAEPCEMRLRRLDGTVVDVEFSAIGITENAAPAVQIALLDVTARKRAEARIRHWAHHDALTGLPNRALLLDRMQQSLAQARRDKQKLAVMMLDLDHFKDINDTLGHPVGDQLLCAVAERLRSIIRENDTLARFGGDELVLIQTGLNDGAGARILAQKIVETLAEPFSVDGQEVRTSGSLGIALFPEGGAVPETLLKNADMALYRAKSRGRTSFEFYVEEMKAEVHTRKALEDDLRRSLERKEFRLLYQPQFHLGTGRLAGVEALLRWRHPERGVMPAHAFLPLAERTGLIGPIGQWVLEEACRQAAAWARAGTAVRVGVNLSAAQCRLPDFVDTLLELLARQDLVPDLLDLEITESLLMDPYGGHGSNNLRRLHEMGIKISIDDFGTGYSSLSHLKSLPIDHVKLDSSFVGGIGRNAEDEAIVRAVIALGLSLDKRIIAEGVETEEQRLFLHQLGCGYAQGHLFADPMPADEIGRALAVGFGVRVAATRTDLPGDLEARELVEAGNSGSGQVTMAARKQQNGAPPRGSE